MMRTTNEEVLSRNAPCRCGSGKKYKRCHLAQDKKQAPKTGKKAKAKDRKIIIKTEAQIEGIRKSSRLTKQLLDMVAERITAGVSTNEIDEWVYEETLAHGATPATLNYGRGKGKRRMPFPKSICTSPNNVICHGIPNNQALRHGDIVNIDVTCNLDGYFGDASRMFIIGEVPDKVRELVKVTRECLDLGIEQVRPYNTFGDVGHTIQQHAEKYGFSVVRDFAGHGVGLQFHEAPQVLHYGEPGKGDLLLPNMVFTIEPMLNIGKQESKVLGDGWTVVTKDGSLSAQWEHTVWVTDSGVEVLTL